MGSQLFFILMGYHHCWNYISDSVIEKWSFIFLLSVSFFFFLSPFSSFCLLFLLSVSFFFFLSPFFFFLSPFSSFCLLFLLSVSFFFFLSPFSSFCLLFLLSVSFFFFLSPFSSFCLLFSSFCLLFLLSLKCAKPIHFYFFTDARKHGWLLEDWENWRRLAFHSPPTSIKYYLDWYLFFNPLSKNVHLLKHRI